MITYLSLKSPNFSLSNISSIYIIGFDDPMMRLNTGLHDEPDLDPSTNFSRKSQPSITTDLSLNVVGVLGKEVRLACHVTNLGNKTVIFALIEIVELKMK